MSVHAQQPLRPRPAASIRQAGCSRKARLVFKVCTATLLAVLAAAAPASLRAADAPELKALFPAGVQTGGSVTARIVGKPGSAPVQAWCNRTDVTLLVADAGDQLTITAAPECPPGLCWIRLHNAAGASALRPFAIGLLPEVQETEPNNALIEAHVIAETAIVVNGVLDQRADVDTFTIPLQAGQTCVASLESSFTFGSPMDGVLQLVSPDGFVLEQNDDEHGIDPQIVFTAPVDGLYAARVFAFPKDPNSSIQFASGDEYIYRLTLTTGPFIDRLMPAPGSDAFVPHGWNLPSDPTPVSLATEDGAVVGTLPYPGSWQLERMPATVGTLRIEPVAEPLTPPATIWGTLTSAAESDEVEFPATPEQPITVSVSARAFGSPLDPLLEIIDESGNVVASKDDNAGDRYDAALTFTPSGAGSFRVRVRDRFGHGGERYVYCLRLVPVGFDFDVSVETETFAVAPGGTLEIPLTIRRTGEPRDLSVTVEGLPAGFTVAYTPPEKPAEEKPLRTPDDPPEKGTLTITAAADAEYRGPISIVATSAGDAPIRRQATAASTNLPFTTPHLWLSTAAAP